MTKDDSIKLAQEAGFVEYELDDGTTDSFDIRYQRFANLVAAAERDALEAELLKLKKGIAANSEYIQGRWDLIGEFQDVIREREEAK
jgi:hypothetical protein